MCRGPEQTCLPGRDTNGQRIYEKILNFNSYYRNANQKHVHVDIKWKAKQEQEKQTIS